MQTYMMSTTRLDGHGTRMTCKSAELLTNTDPAGRIDAFNPAEFLLASVAACMMKGIERVTPMLGFSLRSVTIQVTGERQDSPPRMTRIDYKILVDTDETDRRLEPLHQNVRKEGTISKTTARAVLLNGALGRATTAAN
ncbi:OsmC family protein [Dankookia sp. GCM10030260]|uniref:OsmC family protein n=1 Tax=Dankookia sp. GCM10030260 TaxID=3273390 RepID=UPI00360B5780